MTNKLKYFPLIIGFAIAMGIFLGGKLNFGDGSDKLFSSNSKKDKLNRLIDYIDYEYVDYVNTDSIVDVTVNGILENLDPHSVYIPKEALESVTEKMKGDFVGIGINFYTINDTIIVIRSVEGGPSEKAGIKGGDRILMANGDSIFGTHLNDSVSKKLKGPLNSIVDLTIFRKETPELLEFSVKRSNIPIKSVDASYMLTENLGYIKINRFAETTYKEFKKGIRGLKSKGATQIALDLRNNPGGFIGITEKIADEFLKEDQLILYTKNKSGHIENSYATDEGDFERFPLFVMINEKSASASEIIAGAMQDNDRGTIIGRRSFGKGLVQREMKLGDGSAVRLTVSRYYTPTGRSIQRPYNNGHKDYFDEYFERKNRGELNDSEKIEIEDSLKYITPQGKIVYGGGGIIPDVFIPIDDNEYSESLLFLYNRGFIARFIFNELEKDRNKYTNQTRNDFITNFTVNEEVVTAFEDYIRETVNPNITFIAYVDMVKLYLKATLAKQLFGNGAFEEIINKNDPMVKKAIELSKEN